MSGMLGIMLSVGAIPALIPIIIIIILIAAAAGISRGTDLFAMLGIGSLAIVGRGLGGKGPGKGLKGTSYGGKAKSRAKYTKYGKAAGASANKARKQNKQFKQVQNIGSEYALNRAKEASGIIPPGSADLIATEQLHNMSNGGMRRSTMLPRVKSKPSEFVPLKLSKSSSTKYTKEEILARNGLWKQKAKGAAKKAGKYAGLAALGATTGVAGLLVYKLLPKKGKSREGAGIYSDDFNKLLAKQNINVKKPRLREYIPFYSDMEKPVTVIREGLWGKEPGKQENPGDEGLINIMKKAYGDGNPDKPEGLGEWISLWGASYSKKGKENWYKRQKEERSRNSEPFK